MSCGLTQYELKQLGKLKVIGTVMAENVPQLICQVIYSLGLGGEITSGVQLAFIASALSITASTLSYLIERNTSDTKVVQYYLSTQCSLRVEKHLSMISDDGAKEIATFTQKGEAITKSQDYNDEYLSSPSSKYRLSEEEKQHLIDNRGRTQSLGENIAEVFGIPPKNIEIGSSMITKYGIITHIVHFVYDSDLETMEEELLNEDHTNSINVTAKLFVSQLYASLLNDINTVFRNHFEINSDFDVTFQHRLGIKTRTLKYASDDNYDIDFDTKTQNPLFSNKRDAILKRMVTQIANTEYIGTQNVEETNVSESLDIRDAINDLFKSKGIVDDQEKIVLMKNIINNNMITRRHSFHAGYKYDAEISPNLQKEFESKQEMQQNKYVSINLNEIEVKKMDDLNITVSPMNDIESSKSEKSFDDIDIDQLYVLNDDIQQIQKSVSGDELEIDEPKQSRIEVEMQTLSNPQKSTHL